MEAFTVIVQIAEDADIDALGALMHDSIHTLGAQAYTPEQLNAWSPAPRQGQRARERFAGQTCFIANDAQGPAAFMTLTKTGHLDFAYAHPRAAGRGAASMVYSSLERFARHAAHSEITSDISLIARPFFEKRNFIVVREQHPILKRHKPDQFSYAKGADPLKRLTVISSYVASSRVGGSLALLLGQMLELDPVLIPTTILGRHPGLGAPGGRGVADDDFKSALDGAASNNAKNVDGILTGYFASATQVAHAANFIDEARAIRPDIKLVVDPIFGDSPKGLYVDEKIAQAIATLLVPRADLITPNLFEFQYLFDAPKAKLPRELCDIAAHSERDILITSVPTSDAEIGALYVKQGMASTLVESPLLKGQIPNGTGDVFSLLATSGFLRDDGPIAVTQRAVALVHALIRKAIQEQSVDLPVLESKRLLNEPLNTKVTTL